MPRTACSSRSSCRRCDCAVSTKTRTPSDMGAELTLHVIRPPDGIGLCDIAEARVTSTPDQLHYACRLLTAMDAARKEINEQHFWCCLCSAPVQTTVGITVCAV